MWASNSERFRKVTLTAEDLERLTILDPRHSFNGDGRLLRLGLQAYALGIAYEFDPYFGLSISRVDPLPHQLEAVYDYLLKLARVRFLLADDAGAGKTIMAGLLIRELELRGLAERILIVCPANLAFQWQRELKEKFDDEIPGDEGPGHPRAVRRQPMAGTQSGHHVARSGEASEILPGLRQVHWDLVIVDEAHRMSGRRRVAQEPALPAGRAAARQLRSHPAADRDAAQGRSRRTSACSCSSSTPTPMPT